MTSDVEAHPLRTVNRLPVAFFKKTNFDFEREMFFVTFAHCKNGSRSSVG